MKVVNLDKFRRQTRVVIDGEEYTLRGMTIGQYLDGDYNLSNPDPKEQVRNMLNMLRDMSNIPEDKIRAMSFEEIEVLTKLIQGIDIDDDIKKKGI